MHQLNVPFGDLLRKDMRSMHVKFYEFITHKKGDINLSLLSLSKICRLNEQGLRITSYMKDVVLYEVVPTKFVSSFLELQFIGYEFLKLDNGQVQNLKSVSSSLRDAIHACAGLRKGGHPCWGVVMAGVTSTFYKNKILPT
jgi:hypothetical protein